MYLFKKLNGDFHQLIFQPNINSNKTIVFNVSSRNNIPIIINVKQNDDDNEMDIEFTPEDFNKTKLIQY